MTHIFISYSQTDRAVAQALADDLGKAGQSVWWDAQLYAGQDFHDSILAALDACKVAIVIWSMTAAKSQWVRDEATRAARANKLITCHVPGFDLAQIPLGMGQRQCVNVDNRAEVFRALLSFGLPPRTKLKHTAQPAEPTRPQFDVIFPDVALLTQVWSDHEEVHHHLQLMHMAMAKRPYTLGSRETILDRLAVIAEELNKQKGSEPRVRAARNLCERVRQLIK